MAATSYTTLPSSTYVGLGSQGDLLHSANYGNYDSGIGSIASHPYKYQSTNYGTHLTDDHQSTSYANDYHQSTYPNGDYSTEQPHYLPSDRYAQQSMHNQDHLLNDYANPQTQQYNHRSTIPHDIDEHYATTSSISLPPHKPTLDKHHVDSNNHHETSHIDTTQHHLPAHVDNRYHQSQPPPQSNHSRSEQQTSNPPPKQLQHHPPAPVDHRHHQSEPPIQSSHSRSEHQTSNPPPKQQQHHPPTSVDNQHHQSQPPSQSTHNRSEHQISNHPPKQQQQQQRHHIQPPAQPNIVRSEHQTPKQPPKQQSPPQSNVVRSEHQTSNQPPKQQPPPVRHRSPSNGGNGYPPETTAKTTNPPPEMKTTKSTKMRAAAIKQKEDSREQKRKDGSFPPNKTKSQQKPPQHSPTDGEQSDTGKGKRNKTKSHSVPKQRKSRRDDYQTEDNNTSGEDDNHDHHTRSKSQKRAQFPDPHLERYPLPPVRLGRGRGPPYLDPGFDYPVPPEHAFRGRHPYYDDYPPYGPHQYPGRYDPRQRHLYEDAYDVPPYIASYHDPYDGFFDYEKRKSKSKPKQKHHKETKKEPVTDHEDTGAVTGNESEHDDDAKSQHTKKSKHKKGVNIDDNFENDENSRRQYPDRYYGEPYYDGRDMLEIWRQERNDYLKKKFKPSIHDVLYSQQWMKSDSYLENQRRRAVRDAQGYYFPYKKYTLKDYKDLQKLESQNNPYAAIAEAPVDRKERARKRQEYASQIERQPADASGGQHRTPRDMPPKKPWHGNSGEQGDPEKLSKRERALEYAKVQVVKHKPAKGPKNQSGKSDPTEQYVNSLFPQVNDDGEGSINGRNSKTNQSVDDDDQ